MVFEGRKDTALVQRTCGVIMKKPFHKKYQSSWHIPMTQPVIGEAFSLPSRLDNMKTDTRIFLVYLRKCKYI